MICHNNLFHAADERSTGEQYSAGILEQSMGAKNWVVGYSDFDVF